MFFIIFYYLDINPDIQSSHQIYYGVDHILGIHKQ